MKAVVQRVSYSKIRIDNEIVDEIGHGLVVMIAVTHGDNEHVMEWMCKKLVHLRIFSDDEGKMNKSILDVNGGILLISNFTVYGDIGKSGNRPNFMRSAPPEISEPMYRNMIKYLRENFSIKVGAGVFGAMMEIELVNDGPVTIIIEK